MTGWGKDDTANAEWQDYAAQLRGEHCRADGRFIVPPHIEPFVDLVVYLVCGAALAMLVWNVLAALATGRWPVR